MYAEIYITIKIKILSCISPKTMSNTIFQKMLTQQMSENSKKSPLV